MEEVYLAPEPPMDELEISNLDDLIQNYYREPIAQGQAHFWLECGDFFLHAAGAAILLKIGMNIESLKAFQSYLMDAVEDFEEA